MRKIVLLLALVCFIGIQMVAQYNWESLRTGQANVTHPESVIVNKELKDFCDTTLPPILRGLGFRNSVEALLMDIIPRSETNYDIKVLIWSGDFLGAKRTSSNMLTFCLVDTFYMKIEAPIDCPLIEVKENNLTLNHYEDLVGFCDWPEWYFHTEGDSLIFEKFISGLTIKFKDKVLNHRTGRLQPIEPKKPSYKDPTLKVFNYPESVILNKSLLDFCKYTIVPILRDQDFIFSRGILTMNIQEDRGEYNIEVTIGESGNFEPVVAQKGYIESLSIVDDYPIKIEAPADCPLIQVKENKLDMQHKEGKPQKETEKKWLLRGNDNSIEIIKTPNSTAL